MLIRNLSFQSLPHLRLHDKVYQAVELMNENHIYHLPIVDGEKYIGIVSEEALLQVEDDQLPLKKIEQLFSKHAVKESEHFLTALQTAGENQISIIPVVNEENKLIGTLAYNDLLKQASDFMSLGEPGALIVLEMESNQYSFNEISKLIESNDAQITQLNSSNNQETGMMQVTIRINKPDISDIVATFQRYDYTVKYYVGEELYTNELRSNYDNLMHYLKL